MLEIKDEIAGLITKAAGVGAEEALASLEYGKFGDISSRIAFTLAQKQKTSTKPGQKSPEGANPAKLAAEITKKIATSPYVAKTEAMGPYVNFHLSDKAYASLLSDVLSKKEKYGAGKKKKGKVVIEFPSVNPNKPWHIGHLRNALLGDSVARILEFDGHDVERMDYIDDLGLQVAQSLWGFLNYEQNPHGKFDLWLGEQYVGIARKFEEDKTLMEDVREVLRQIEEGGNEVAEAGRKLAERCVLSQYETAFAFGIYHDVLVFESDIMENIFDEGIESIKDNKAVVIETEGKNEGCLVVKLSEDFEKEFGKLENPDKVLVRSDGTAVYTGKDVIFHLWKFGKLKKGFKYEPFVKQPNGKTAYMSSARGKPMDFGDANSVINVICVDQKYPQRVVAEVLKRMDFEDEARNLHHLSYELVGLPDEKFSGRKGTWIGYTADELLAEGQTRVMDKIKTEMEDGEKKNVARMVSAAAIKFSFLRTGPEKRITFKWEEALNMEGDSGPYLQYAYVRTQGILGKTKEKPSVEEVQFNPQEKQLIKKLAQFQDMVARSAKELAPHHLAQYGLEVAGEFSSFYTTSPVLTAEDEKTRKTRLAITMATSIVLKNSLGLIGIDCPERM